MSNTFKKKKEDFKCENCGFKVKGSGYTNHCPSCLYSKHVDIFPGDRLEECKGLMKPIGVDKKDGEYILIHKCIKCGVEKRNKISKEDNFEEIVKLS
jgi:hypothetical protein